MDREGFQQFLTERELPEGEIRAAIGLAEGFEGYLKTIGHSKGTKADVNAFSTQLVADGEDTMANYYALARYGRFVKNDDVYVAVVDLLDGAEALGNLEMKAEQVLGPDRRDLVFQGVPIPGMGIPNETKIDATRKVINRLVEVADPAECEQILADSLRDLEDSWFQDEKKLYEECGCLDDFLDKNAQNFIAMLEKIRDEEGLFFTQKITDDVVEYVRGEPLIARGVREGDILYEVKIPHMTAEFLAESDPQKKRYFYCHCPWVKEALKDGEADIPPVFCTCSAGFHKKRWEVVLDQPLKAEIVESVLAGDDWCKIAIHLPEGLE